MVDSCIKRLKSIKKFNFRYVIERSKCRGDYATISPKIFLLKQVSDRYFVRDKLSVSMSIHAYNFDFGNSYFLNGLFILYYIVIYT